MLRTVFLGQPDVWALTLTPADEVVGAIALIPDPKRNHPGARMIGYRLARPLWGQGYMTEAARAVLAYDFEPQRLSLVTATCYPAQRRLARGAAERRLPARRPRCTAPNKTIGARCSTCNATT